MKFVSTLLFTLLFAFATSATAQTTAFTYQGRLTDNVTPQSATYDLEFALYDSSSSIVGNPIQRNGTPVNNGVFTVSLDFGGNAFPGASRFLEIRVKRPGEPSYTPLTPRQQVTSAPYSIYARDAASADRIGSALLTSRFGGDIGSVPSGSTWVFLGPTTSITGRSGEIMAITGSATLSQNTEPFVSVKINLCVRRDGDVTQPMFPEGEQFVDVFNRRVTHTISYSQYAPNPGPQEFGFCAINGSPVTLNNNGKVTGWLLRWL